MSAATLFTCDACGNTGMDVPGDYLYPDPPKGWIWWYGGGLLLIRRLINESA